MLMEDAASNEEQPAAIIVPVPNGFRHDDALLRVSRLLISLLESGMPEHEINKRLMRYHPLTEG